MAGKNSLPEFSTIEGMDPAADWLLGPAINDFLPDPDGMLIPFLLELDDDASIDAFNDLPVLDREKRDGSLVLGFAGGAERIRTGGYLPVLAPLTWFTKLRDSVGAFERFRSAKKRIILSTPVEISPEHSDFFHRSIALGASGPTERAWAETTVFTAVIDDGLAFAHERLRLGDAQTRVQAFWNMNALFGQAGTGTSSPLGLPGEILKDGIDALLATQAPGGVVDEDAIYAAAGLIDHRDPRHKAVAWRRSHGAHVLDLAAGHEREAQVADRPVIAVQLPTWVVAQTSGLRLDFYLWFAILYILDRADRLAGQKGPPKLVINTSFGYIAAPHDGKAPLDRFMNKVIADRRPDTQIVLSAGNAHLSRCHAVIDFAERDTVAFDLIVQPGDRTDSIVEVWLPEEGPADDRVIMTVKLPDGTEHAILEREGERVDLTTAAGALTGRVLLASVDGQRMFHLAIAPTERPQPHPGLLAPAGRWGLTFAKGKAMADVAHAWVQRDDSLYGYPQRGRQSYFEHGHYVRFDDQGFLVTDDEDPAQAAKPCPVTRRSLFSAIASGSEVITAGGYHERDLRVAPYSAGGPNCPPENGSAQAPRKPDVLLPSDGSKAHPGVLAAGARSGGRTTMNGTSVAAPQLARYVVDRLAASKPADRSALAAAAQQPPGSPSSSPPDPVHRSGWGRFPRLNRLTVERFEPEQ